MAKNPPPVELPKGINRIWTLPDTALGTLWDSIILPDALKSRLVSQAVLNFTVRPKVDRSVVPLHGVILLIGPPGTGKTSLAQGLAHRAAVLLKGNQFRLLEVEPHSLTSSAMGKTQRAVADLFSQSIAEAAATGPTIVLLDEVETLAVDRTKLSLDANPVDIHRATDAVLVQLDLLADQYPNLLILATSNFPQAVDAAFTSRCDLVMEIPLPDGDACQRILKDCLIGLAKTFPKLESLTKSPQFGRCAQEFVGLDGRTIRKIVVNAMTASHTTALDPNQVTLEDLCAAARMATTLREKAGKKP